MEGNRSTPLTKTTYAVPKIMAAQQSGILLRDESNNPCFINIEKRIIEIFKKSITEGHTFTYRQMALEMGTSEDKVKKGISDIYKKIGIKESPNRIKLILWIMDPNESHDIKDQVHILHALPNLRKSTQKEKSRARLEELIRTAKTPYDQNKFLFFKIIHLMQYNETTRALKELDAIMNKYNYRIAYAYKAHLLEILGRNDEVQEAIEKCWSIKVPLFFSPNLEKFLYRILNDFKPKI